MADQEPTAHPTLLERLVRAGIGEDRAPGLIVAGHIRVEGEVVNDLERVTPFGQRWVVAGQ